VGSFIGPDHLLYGLGRASINFAIFCLLPIENRSLFERVLRDFIHANDLTFPHSFIDVKDAKLSKVSITQVFTILVFAPVAYTITIRLGYPQRIPAPTIAAAQVLREIHQVVALLAQPPHHRVNPKHVQVAVSKYLKILRSVCARKLNELTFPDLPRRGTGGGAQEVYKDIEQLTRAAIRKLDTVNVHRIYEYAFFVLPAVQFPSFSRELPMEKVHVHVKRLLERAGAYHAHYYAMNGTVMDDWKSRLSLLTIPVPSNDRGMITFAVRLLAGEEESNKITPISPLQDLSVAINDRIQSAGFSPLNFMSRGVSVFPRKASAPNMWTTVRTRSTFFPFSDPSFANLDPLLRNLVRGIALARDPDAQGLYVCERMHVIPDYGKESAPVMVDHFLSVQCHHPTDVALHSPFVNQVSRSETLNPSDTMFWKVVTIFAPALTVRESEVIFVVKPYLRSTENAMEIGKANCSFMHFDGFSEASVNCSLLYADSSVRAVASFHLHANYVPPVDATVFLFGHKAGFPVRQG